MLENGNILLVVCLVILLGLGLPISIYFAARRGNGFGEIELLKRAGQRARNPWQPEDKDLAELSKRVEELRDKPGKES